MSPVITGTLKGTRLSITKLSSVEGKIKFSQNDVERVCFITNHGNIAYVLQKRVTSGCDIVTTDPYCCQWDTMLFYQNSEYRVDIT